MKTIDAQEIKEAVKTLRGGGVVLFPTETAYGLAADATNAKAVTKVAKLKGRPKEKTFPLIVSSVAMADRYGHLRCLGRRLAKVYWPGPLTLVVEARKGSKLVSGVARDDGTIAVRVSSHPVAQTLSRKLGKPIVSTSANKAGRPVAYRVEDTQIEADFTIDSGKLPKRKPSTIARIVNKRIEVLRKGPVKPVDPKMP